MKTKHSKSGRLNKAEKQALLNEVAAKLSKEPVLFKEKVARAKALLEIAVFPPSFPSLKK
jgi:hypothetical protein